MSRRSYLYASLMWTAIWWALSWSRLPILSEYAFLPLWVGYISVMNTLPEVLWGKSLIRHLGWNFGWLFVISIPFWWIFEYFNQFVQNWHYLLLPISHWHWIVQSSIDFATVIPAVLSTAFVLIHLFKQNSKEPQQAEVQPVWLIVLILAGAAGLWLIEVFPQQAFPLLWLAPLLIIDPVNYRLGLSSVLGLIENGRWRVLSAVAAATLVTGVWWECWNYLSLPKWYYTIPYIGFAKVFEMPVLGFLGYLPFGLIIYTYTSLALGCFKIDLERVLTDDDQPMLHNAS